MTQRNTIEDNPTIFGKIIRKEIPADVVYEDDKILVFKDIAPKAPIHIVVISKEHVISMQDVTDADAELMAHIMVTIPKIAVKVGIAEGGYRVISNIGKDGGQEIPHLHFHILGGAQLGAIVGD